MSWPTGPPPMPPPGWYADPEQVWTWRWFDGLRWTELRAPMSMPPGRDPRSLSVWFERSTASVKVAVRQVGLMLLVLWLTLAAATWVLVVRALGGDRGRELRRLLEIDETTFGPVGSSNRVELTTAEAERVRELLGEIFWSALPWLVALGLAGAIASCWSTAIVARVAVRHLVDTGEGGAEPRAATAGAAFRRVPAVFLSGVVVFLIFAGVLAAASAPVALVAIVDGGGAAVLLTVVFTVLLATVAAAWLWGRLTLASVIAAAGGHGIGVRRSWALTHDNFWFVVGRLLVAGLIATAASGAVTLVLNAGFLLNLALFFALLLVLQTIALVAAMIITVCSYLAIIDQIEPFAAIAEPDTIGSSADGSHA